MFIWTFSTCVQIVLSLSIFWRPCEAFFACYHADSFQCVQEAVLEVLYLYIYIIIILYYYIYIFILLLYYYLYIYILVLISRPAKELLDFMDKEAENIFKMLFRKTCCQFFWNKTKFYSLRKKTPDESFFVWSTSKFYGEQSFEFAYFPVNIRYLYCTYRFLQLFQA